MRLALAFGMSVCALFASSAPLGAVPPDAAKADSGYRPTVAGESKEGEQAIKSFLHAKDLKIDLFAAEPRVANVVAFTFDERGRLFAAETFRQNMNTGAEDNRSHGEWLDDDLAAQTVEDRLAYMKKHRGDLSSYTREHDRIRLVEDRDGDGRADHDTIFADGFNGVLDGTGAGVLFRGGDLFYTCIPHLWRLRDQNGDGKADERTSLHRGYGVRFAFRGHDMHGLIVGPDGKLYYSIGDRGFNVETSQGRLTMPDRGAVFRCNLDGSELEVVHSGLRNPQELAFDEFGNLFSGDNNSDSGDRARWIQIVDGADSGWRMYYQYLGDRGPWNREKLWHPQHEGQPAYIVPPIINITDGPSGLAYYPGTGLPERYRGHFLLCDFRGSPGQSGVHSFAMKPKGASFELVDHDRFVWAMLATDVGFGPDGGAYVSDWVEGWNGPGKARIYRVTEPSLYASDAVKEVRCLLAEGFSKRPTEQLAKLLQHVDMRVRQEAQFELAERGATDPTAREALAKVARESKHQLARLHAIWGLGQISRKPASNDLSQPLEVLSAVVPLAKDSDAEVRAQFAKVLGYRNWPPAVATLVALLGDESPRVQMMAALALGKQTHEAIAPLCALLDKNADRDPYVRHAVAVALAATAAKSEAALVGRIKGKSGELASPAVRLGILLALRRAGSPTVASLLGDPLPAIVEEAARAIHDDAGIDSAWPQLAAALEPALLTDPTTRRALNANYRLGGDGEAERVARFAARKDAATHLRVEALKMLAEWDKPSPKDRVTGMWRPIATRSAEPAAKALRPMLGAVIAAGGDVGRQAARTAATLGIREIGPALVAIAADGAQPAAARGEALAALAQLRDSRAAEAIEKALGENDATLRAAALRVWAKVKGNESLPRLRTAFDSGGYLEQQASLEAAALLATSDADQLIASSVDKLLSAAVPREIQLDILMAAERRSSDALKAKLAKYEAKRTADDVTARYVESLHGGDAERGRRLFFEGSRTSCVRCHQAGAVGGLVGPDLTHVAKDAKKDRAYLLASIVDPNRAIAEGFQTTMLALADGQVAAGIVKSEDDKVVKLMTPEGQLLVVEKENIDQRRSGKSAMPEDLMKTLTKSELRDLVEFLTTLK